MFAVISTAETRQMLFLLLATLASAGNALTMKYAGSRSSNQWSLLLFNYLAATALSCGQGVRSGLVLGEVASHEWALGLVTGVLFIASFALLQLNVRTNGATVSSSLARMGSVVPMLLSIVLFAEYPTLAGAGGIALAIAATMLLSVPQPDAAQPDAAQPMRREGTKGRSPFVPSARKLLVPMVLAGGLADTLPKVFEVYGNPEHEEAFILTTFAVAFGICLVMLLRAHERPAGVDIACGAMLGVFNYFSTDLMLRALMELPAYVVYTGFSMGVVLVVYAANTLVMHERLTRRDHVAIALVLLALVLINLPR